MARMEDLMTLLQRCEDDSRRLLGPLAAQRLGNWQRDASSQTDLIEYVQRLLWGSTAPMERGWTSRVVFHKALRIFEEKQVPGSNMGVALNGLGLVHNARGLYVQALSCFERALEIIRTEHGLEFSDCATVLRNMAISLQEIGEGRRAEDALEQARQIDRKESSSAR